jgi:hypothetical protein
MLLRWTLDVGVWMFFSLAHSVFAFPAVSHCSPSRIRPSSTLRGPSPYVVLTHTYAYKGLPGYRAHECLNSPMSLGSSAIAGGVRGGINRSQTIKTFVGRMGGWVEQE